MKNNNPVEKKNGYMYVYMYMLSLPINKGSQLLQATDTIKSWYTYVGSIQDKIFKKAQYMKLTM